MSRFRPIFALLSAAALACSPDKVTGSKDPLATRLTEIGDSSVAADYRIASALYAASAMVRAGGKVSSVQILVDSEPRIFSAVATRVSYSTAACDQLKNMFMIYEGTDSAGVFDLGEFDPCRPMQSLIGWEGESMSRVVVIQGDTGTSTMDFESPYQWNFWGELYDREAKTEWWLRSGTQSSAKVSDGQTCRAASIPEQGIEFACRLVTLRHSFDLVLEEYPVLEFPRDSLLRGAPRADVRGDSIFSDTAIFVDSTWVWEPGPSHTLSMPAHVVNGLAMEITRFDFEGWGSAIQASARQGARFRRSRTR